jgi:bifunctional non-homologous end joining protein LigD
MSADPRNGGAGRGRIGSTKHDGYRLTVHREGKRVRLFTRNGHDWTDRYPLIVEAALRIRIGSFVLDREAVLLGVDGRSDFDGLHSRQHNDAMLGTSASTALHVGSRSSFVS